MLTTAQEVRIYADENGKYLIPKEYRANVSYGNGIRMFCSIMILIGTIKRRGLNIFTRIKDLFEGRPVIA